MLVDVSQRFLTNWLRCFNFVTVFSLRCGAVYVIHLDNLEDPVEFWDT